MLPRRERPDAQWRRALLVAFPYAAVVLAASLIAAVDYDEINRSSAAAAARSRPEPQLSKSTSAAQPSASRPSSAPKIGSHPCVGSAMAPSSSATAVSTRRER